MTDGVDCLSNDVFTVPAAPILEKDGISGEESGIAGEGKVSCFGEFIMKAKLFFCVGVGFAGASDFGGKFQALIARDVWIFGVAFDAHSGCGVEISDATRGVA